MCSCGRLFFAEYFGNQIICCRDPSNQKDRDSIPFWTMATNCLLVQPKPDLFSPLDLIHWAREKIELSTSSERWQVLKGNIGSHDWLACLLSLGSAPLCGIISHNPWPSFHTFCATTFTLVNNILEKIHFFYSSLSRHLFLKKNQILDSIFMPAHASTTSIKCIPIARLFGN